jgi:hypothetical protein
MNHRIERVDLISSIFYVCIINDEFTYPIYYKNGEWLISIYGGQTTPYYKACRQSHINYLVFNNIASIKQEFQDDDTILILNPHVILELI